MTLPQKFCNQLRYIWEDTIGPYTKPGLMGPISRAQWKMGNQPISNIAWQELYRKLEREQGLAPLKHEDADRLELFVNFVSQSDLTDALRAIEIVFETVYLVGLDEGKKEYWEVALLNRMKGNPAKAIEELNRRFIEHSLPYQFQDGKLISIRQTSNE